MKILGYTYELIVDGDSDALGAFGRIDPSKQIIRIASGLNDQQFESSILHEIIEALNYHFHMEMLEGVIMSLEAGLYQALVDNGVDLSPLRVSGRGGDV